MGATTFMQYSKERARKAALAAKEAEAAAKKAKGKEKAAAKKEAKKQKTKAANLKKEAAKFSPKNTARKDKPEEVTDKKVMFQNPTALDLDGDGKPDVTVSRIKK